MRTQRSKPWAAQPDALQGHSQHLGMGTFGISGPVPQVGVGCRNVEDKHCKRKYKSINLAPLYTVYLPQPLTQNNTSNVYPPH